MDKLEKVFESLQVLSASDLNEIVNKINEIIEKGSGGGPSIPDFRRIDINSMYSADSKSVFLLKKLDNSDDQFKFIMSGKIICEGNASAGVKPMVLHFDACSTHVGGYGYVESYGYINGNHPVTSIFSVVTCTYRGEEYIALGIDSQIGDVFGGGKIYFIGICTSSEIDGRCPDYYYYYDESVVNEEINSSISVIS